MHRHARNPINYKGIDDFAPNINNAYSTDPLSYCVPDILDSQFLHGTQGRIDGKYSMKCQEFMSARCAGNWDGVCEAASQDPNIQYPNMAEPVGPSGDQQLQGLTAGEILVRNTAYKKYKKRSANCNLRCEPFDPTVANSPLVCFETREPCGMGPSPNEVCSGDVQGGQCFSEYYISNEQIAQLDKDPVMNKLLAKPEIAPQLLDNIHSTMKRKGILSKLHGTRLGYFYQMNGLRL
jgi:hypothetical protein